MKEPKRLPGAAKLRRAAARLPLDEHARDLRQANRRLAEQIEEHKRTERESAEQLRLEALIADLSSKFVNLPPREVDREIKDAQRQICGALGLDMAALWQWSDDEQDVFIFTHYYSEQDSSWLPERIDATQYFPWFQRETAAGRRASGCPWAEAVSLMVL